MRIVTLVNLGDVKSYQRRQVDAPSWQLMYNDSDVKQLFSNSAIHLLFITLFISNCTY